MGQERREVIRRAGRRASVSRRVSAPRIYTSISPVRIVEHLSGRRRRRPFHLFKEEAATLKKKNDNKRKMTEHIDAGCAARGAAARLDASRRPATRGRRRSRGHRRFKNNTEASLIFNSPGPTASWSCFTTRHKTLETDLRCIAYWKDWNIEAAVSAV